MANKEFVRILKKAKLHLWDGIELRDSVFDVSLKPRHICFALENASDSRNKDKLQEIIMRRLGSSSTVEGYLDRKGFIKFKRQTTKPAIAKIQAFRHAWINELIREYS